jgi:hypothetical protein
MNHALLVTPDPDLTRGRRLKVFTGLETIDAASDDGWDLISFATADDVARWAFLMSRARNPPTDKRAEERRRQLAGAFFSGAVAMTVDGQLKPSELAETMRVKAWQYANKKIPGGAPLPPPADARDAREATKGK